MQRQPPHRQGWYLDSAPRPAAFDHIPACSIAAATAVRRPTWAGAGPSQNATTQSLGLCNSLIHTACTFGQPAKISHHELRSSVSVDRLYSSHDRTRSVRGLGSQKGGFPELLGIPGERGTSIKWPLAGGDLAEDLHASFRYRWSWKPTQANEEPPGWQQHLEGEQ